MQKHYVRCSSFISFINSYVKKSLLRGGFLFAFFVMLVIGAITYYNLATKKFNPDFMDIVSFANNLNSLQSDKEVITLNYNEITPFQKDLFSKIDCVNSICNTLNLKKYPPNTYLRIYYKESKFDSFYFYIKNNSSIFSFNTTPYNNWISDITFDRFKEEQIILIKREKKRYPNMNPFITHLSKTFDHVSIYHVEINIKNTKPLPSGGG